MSLAAAALLGFGLGLKHALEADHVAAVCTLVSRDAGAARAARLGALWGAGHGAVIILAGSAMIALGLRVPGPVASVLDAAVAVMLIGLGVSALRGAQRPAHAGHDHAKHDHAKAPGPARPLWIGMVHGASGTAALTLLVATTIPGRAEGVAFVTLFGAASIAAMSGAAALLAWSIAGAARWAPASARGLARAAGVGSIAAGIAVFWVMLVP